jgi:hypothetical protein
MMKLKLFLIVLVTISVSSSVSIVYGIFNPLSSSDWNNLGNTVGSWVESSYRALYAKFENVPACAQVVPLGAQWALTKAAYETAAVGAQAASLFLEGVKKAQSLDPRILQKKSQIANLQLRKEGWVRIRTGAYNVLELSKDVVSATGNVGINLAKIIEYGVDLKRIELRARFDQLATGKIQQFGLTFGRRESGTPLVDFDTELDLAAGAKDVAKRILTAIVKRRLLGL